MSYRDGVSSPHMHQVESGESEELSHLHVCTTPSYLHMLFSSGSSLGLSPKSKNEQERGRVWGRASHGSPFSPGAQVLQLGNCIGEKKIEVVSAVTHGHVHI